MVGRQSRSQSSMALGGPVYQPTTVTYESGGGGCGGGGGGRWRARFSWPAPLLLRVGLLVGALVLTPVGLKLIIDGSLVSSTTNLVIGILLLLIGISLFGVLIHLWLRRRGGWPSDKQGVEAGGGVTGAALGAPNPSTDPLVAAQYAPVRDAPPADDERRQLMDNKECLSSAEESDRMLESDPRIVLRPLKNVDEA